jgi:[ribosomal protein S18]-alanine N-acetyltransferase
MAAVLEQPDILIREMVKADLATVATIETASYPFPWSKAIFSDCLRVGYRCQVLCIDGQVSGYGIVSMALDEAHLLNLCIAPTRRRQGLAELLLNQLVDELRMRGMDRLFLEVRPSNRAALALYRRSGFKVIGRRPGYYPAEQGREDATIMVLHLDPTGA